MQCEEKQESIIFKRVFLPDSSNSLQSIPHVSVILSRLSSMAWISIQGQLHSGNLGSQLHQQSLSLQTNSPSPLQAMQLRAACTKLSLRQSGRITCKPVKPGWVQYHHQTVNLGSDSERCSGNIVLAELITYLIKSINQYLYVTDVYSMCIFKNMS